MRRSAAGPDEAPRRAAPSAVPRVGYLLSKYPSTNHTYLVREVLALRAAGFDVAVAAVDGDDRPLASVPEPEREERARTFAVKRQTVPRIVTAHAATLVTRPAHYFRAVIAAVRLAGPDLGRLAYHLFYFGEAVVAGRYLWKAGCTHVHTHYATTVTLLAARVFPFEISATIHGSAEFINPDAQRLREKIEACSFVRAISSYGRSQLMLASAPSQWWKFSVVRLGIDPAQFRQAGVRTEPAPFRLLSIGQLQPAKGFHVLLTALAKLTHDGRNIRLTLVGDGPDEDSLRQHADRLGVAERVTFAGPRSQPEVRTLLEESDAFVLPSFAEGIPVVLMEAMATGLACVATRITGVPELIEHGSDGLLVTPSDESDLAAAISRLANDPDLRRKLGVAARARVVRDYDLARNTGDLVRLFRERIAPG